MYYLMNKDKVVLEFKKNAKSEFSDDVSFSIIDKYDKTPFGFEDITLWIESRKALKHNSHLKMIMSKLRCSDNEGFIRLTHATGINDTFWIKSDKENGNCFNGIRWIYIIDV